MKRSRPNPVNRKRRAKAFVRNYGSKEHVEAMKSEGCYIARIWSPPMWMESGRPTCWGPLDAAHARAKGMGGAKGDVEDLVCLCRGHHTEAGEYRTTQRAEFEQKYRADLQEEARRGAAKEKAGGPWESLPY